MREQACTTGLACAAVLVALVSTAMLADGTTRCAAGDDACDSDHGLRGLSGVWAAAVDAAGGSGTRTLLDTLLDIVLGKEQAPLVHEGCAGTQAPESGSSSTTAEAETAEAQLSTLEFVATRNSGG